MARMSRAADVYTRMIFQQRSANATTKKKKTPRASASARTVNDRQAPQRLNIVVDAADATSRSDQGCALVKADCARMPLQYLLIAGDGVSVPSPSISRSTFTLVSSMSRNTDNILPDRDNKALGPDTSQSLAKSDANVLFTAAQNVRSSGPQSEGSRDVQWKGAEETHAGSNKQPYSSFGTRTKLFAMIMAAGAAFLSPLSGNIYYPALNSLASEFAVSSSTINLTLTVYMIMQALAPTIFGDFADMCGRRPAYLAGFTLYLAANIGIALVRSFAGLLVLRCLQSAGSSGMIALASGVAADISTSGERGKYMGWVLSGAMVGPAIGPVIGGLLAEYLGWRSIFWFLTILTGCFLVPFGTALPETGRNVVGDGSIPPQPWNKSFFDLKVRRQRLKGLDPAEHTRVRQADEDARTALASKRQLHIPNPLNALRIICQPDAAVLLAFNSINFAAFYDISASLPYLLREIYGFNELQIGLCFLPFGVGCFMAPLFNGPLLEIGRAHV